MSSFQRANLTPFLNSSQRTLLKGGMSCSGSETDMSSTSNENLTSEERHAIMNGVRQEPQGEERIATELSNTLIIHKNDCHDYNSPFYGKESFDNSNYLHSPCSAKDCSSSTDCFSSPLSSNKSSPQRSPTTRLKDHGSLPVQEITEIPKHYLDQSEVLKHLAKELHHHLPPSNKKKSNQDSSSGGSSLRKSGLSRHKSGSSMDKNSPGCRMSLSHPDLTTLGLGSIKLLDPPAPSSGAILHKLSQRPKTKGRAATFDSESEEYSANKQMLSLALENVTLKQERELFVRKVSKLQKLESELIKLSQAHQELVQSQDKREKLELAIRARLEGEVRRLQELANQYKEQLESYINLHNPGAPNDLTTLKNELKTREQLIQQIMTTNRELMAERERQDLELQAQRATLQEQRNHIAILDSALVSAQETVVRLDAEANRAQAFADRCAQLQQNLNAVKAASERQLQMEKKFRLQLEKEIEAQKARNAGSESECKNCKAKPENVQELKKAIREKEEKIISLEAEVTKWEQRYHEENALRQMAVDAASLPKDAKIAALEKTSQEFDRLMQQARQDQLKHMDELYAAQRKITELEGKMKDLESKLAERDAMITVLQKSHRPEKSAETDLVGWARSHVRSASSTVTLSSPSTTSPLHHRATSRDELAVTAVTSTLPSTKVVGASADRSPEVRLSNKDSLITALKVEKERHPSHYWQV